jgi:flagellar basal-body rod protein FlgF
MDNGIYVSISRQLALFRDADITANNIANANTTGFNSEHIMFNSYLTKLSQNGKDQSIAFANDIDSYRDMKVGSFSKTGNQLDMAINGNGYFVVETPLGKRYTRAGNFQVDNNGTLVTPEGYPVLDSGNSPISLPEDTITVEVGSAGNLKVNGTDFGSINVVKFDNPQTLERLSNRLFKSSVEGTTADDVTVAQGMLESSNVEAAKEMTHLISLNRGITETAQYIATMYDLQRKAANAWAQQS